jgi:hypothetical protein
LNIKKYKALTYQVELYHSSKYNFEFPSIEMINNLSLDHHEKAKLGLWCTTKKYFYSNLNKFGEYKYLIIPNDDSIILDIGADELRNFYYKYNMNNSEILDLFDGVDILYLDQLESIVLKFDNIKFKKIDTTELNKTIDYIK